MTHVTSAFQACTCGLMKASCLGGELDLGGTVKTLILDHAKCKVCLRDLRGGTYSWIHVSEAQRFLDQRYQSGSHFSPRG